MMLLLMLTPQPDMAQQQTRLINNWRDSHGTHRLVVRTGLVRAAYYHNAYDLRNDIFSHGMFRSRLLRFYPAKGYSYWSAGEILAIGSAMTPRRAFLAWLRSPEHRKILARGIWRDIGAACTWGEYKGRMVYMWTVDFGRRIKSQGVAMVRYAKRYLGTPYVYGGAAPGGFDCSGLTRFVYSHFGVFLPHNAAAQQDMGHFVSKPAAGDLVFFGDPAYHVGIYAGGGQMVVAPHTGDVVKLQSAAGYSNARSY